MRRNQLLATLGSAIGALVFATSAHAALITFDFADPDADTPLAFTSCGTADEDRCGNTLTFSKSGVSVTASGAGPSGSRPVLQDLNPDRGGLGVINNFNGFGNDNVHSEETIILTFATAISLQTVRFFDDHEPLPHSFSPGANVLFTVDEEPEVSMSLVGPMGPKGFEVDFGGLVGTTFFFRHGGGGSVDDFYISGVTVQTEEEAPEPGTLLLLGAGLLGLVGRSRRRTR